MVSLEMEKAKEDLELCMEHIVAVVDNTETSLLEKMKMSHILSDWLMISGLASQVTELEHMPRLELFWEQLRELDIELNQLEREALLRDWLEG